MAKDKYQHVTDALKKSIEEVDIDGVIYRLCEAVCERRNKADDEDQKPDGNRAEARYWQQVVEIMLDTQTKIEAL